MDRRRRRIAQVVSRWSLVPPLLAHLLQEKREQNPILCHGSRYSKSIGIASLNRLSFIVVVVFVMMNLVLLLHDLSHIFHRTRNVRAAQAHWYLMRKSGRAGQDSACVRIGLTSLFFV